jgi:hypothetical protein
MIKGLRSKAQRRFSLSLPLIALVIAIASLMLVGESSPRPVAADHVPEPPDQLVYTATFNTTRPEMFGPSGPVPSPATTPWSISVGMRDLPSAAKSRLVGISALRASTSLSPRPPSEVR